MKFFRAIETGRPRNYHETDPFIDPTWSFQLLLNAAFKSGQILDIIIRREAAKE
jgi:hypothetical protein